MLHLKDLKAGYSVSTTLDTESKDTDATIGDGVIDWKQLFSAVPPGQVKQAFVEHEGAMARPPMESIQITFDYLKQLERRLERRGRTSRRHRAAQVTSATPFRRRRGCGNAKSIDSFPGAPHDIAERRHLICSSN